MGPANPDCGPKPGRTACGHEAWTRRVSGNINPTVTFFGREVLQLLGAERLHGEGGDRAPVHGRKPEIHVRELPVAAAGQIPHEPAREAVACARRVEDRLEGVRRGGEYLAVRQVKNPVFAALDHHSAWAPPDPAT